MTYRYAEHLHPSAQKDTHDAHKREVFYGPYIPVTHQYVRRFKVPSREHTAKLVSDYDKVAAELIQELNFEEETVHISELAPKELIEFYRRQAKPASKPVEKHPVVVVEPPTPFYRRWWDKIRNFKIEIPLDGPNTK